MRAPLYGRPSTDANVSGTRRRRTRADQRCRRSELFGIAKAAPEVVAAPVAATPNAAQAVAKKATIEEKAFGREGDPKKVTHIIPVDMSDAMRYSPMEITVKRGDTVRFVGGWRGTIGKWDSEAAISLNQNHVTDTTSKQVLKDVSSASLQAGLLGQAGGYDPFVYWNPASVVNPMLTGRFQWAEAAEKKRAGTCLTLRFEDGHQLRYADARRMGRWYPRPYARPWCVVSRSRA